MKLTMEEMEGYLEQKEPGADPRDYCGNRLRLRRAHGLFQSPVQKEIKDSDSGGGDGQPHPKRRVRRNDEQRKADANQRTDIYCCEFFPRFHHAIRRHILPEAAVTRTFAR